MDVIPLVDEGLGNSAYVVDLGDGGALVVDPERDPRPYLAELDRRGLAPRFVVETHLHADFVSGGRELAACGAQLLAPAGSALTYSHRALRDGDELELGGLTLEVIATPGHTPEHLAYLLRDGSRAVALFSGGTLMAGGVARPDLLSVEQTEAAGTGRLPLHPPAATDPARRAGGLPDPRRGVVLQPHPAGPDRAGLGRHSSRQTSAPTLAADAAASVPRRTRGYPT